MSVTLDRLRAVLEHAEKHGLGEHLLQVGTLLHTSNTPTVQLFASDYRIPPLVAWGRSLAEPTVQITAGGRHVHVLGLLESGDTCRVVAVLDEAEAALLESHCLKGDVEFAALAALAPKEAVAT